MQVGVREHRVRELVVEDPGRPHCERKCEVLVEDRRERVHNGLNVI
eukprot:SAG11_NODE_25195_length_362_cov_0.946768_1_plen_45_part_10